MAQWIRFKEIASSSPKTKRWAVVTQEAEIQLGIVAWYGAWRGYAFYPQSVTLFEHKCLRDIADFVEARSKEHREANRERRQPVHQ